jgi:hypothetical protein
MTAWLAWLHPYQGDLRFLACGRFLVLGKEINGGSLRVKRFSFSFPRDFLSLPLLLLTNVELLVEISIRSNV